MATTPTDFSALQPSDYPVTDFSLQDYSSVDNGGLSSVTLDNPTGYDPFGVPNPDPVPPGTDPLSVSPNDASAGLNAFDPSLLPLAPVSTVGPSLYDLGSGVDASGAGLAASGNTLVPTDNLPLTQPNKSNMTALGSPTVSPIPVATPMGSGLWAKLFSFGVGTVLGVAGGGTAGTAPNGAMNPGTVKAAPKTATTNPISGMSTGLIILAAFGIIGAVIWSFSGAK